MSDVYCPRRASSEQDVGQQLHLKRPGARGNAWCKKYQCMSQNCLFSLKESQHRRHTERLSQRMSGIMVIFRHLKRALGMLLSSCKTKYTLDQFCRQLVCSQGVEVGAGVIRLSDRFPTTLFRTSWPQRQLANSIHPHTTPTRIDNFYRKLVRSHQQCPLSLSPRITGTHSR